VLRLAVEIKSGRRVASADLSGVRSFREAHPSTRVVVVAPCREPYRVADVDVLPVDEYLALIATL